MPEKITGVTILMPTFNEAGNIADLICESVASVRDAGIADIEILVVDDDSPDRTWEIASALTCEPASVRVIRRMTEHGLTNSLREGISEAKHDVVVWLDCDFSHPPQKIPQLIYMLEQGFDIAVNSRYTIGGFLQLVLSRTLNWSVRFLLYSAFSDYTSGFVAARRSVLVALPLRGDYGEYFVDFIFRALRSKYRVCELPYWAAPRRSGESKTGSTLWQYWRRGRKYLWTVLRLRLETFRGGKPNER